MGRPRASPSAYSGPGSCGPRQNQRAIAAGGTGPSGWVALREYDTQASRCPQRHRNRSERPSRGHCRRPPNNGRGSIRTAWSHEGRSHRTIRRSPCSGTTASRATRGRFGSGTGSPCRCWLTPQGTQLLACRRPHHSAWHPSLDTGEDVPRRVIKVVLSGQLRIEVGQQFGQGSIAHCLARGCRPGERCDTARRRHASKCSCYVLAPVENVAARAARWRSIRPCPSPERYAHSRQACATGPSPSSGLPETPQCAHRCW